MSLNCSLVNPNEFSFMISGCSNEIHNKCNNNGYIRKLFKVELPAGINRGILSITISNDITSDSISKSIIVPDPQCNCENVCINENNNNSFHTISVEFNNLIMGDKYTGTACFEYID